MKHYEVSVHPESSPAARVVNVIVAGLGGQGVLTASDILAEAAFAAGLDVKKADVHGMAQRGGSVRSDVRFGIEVASPMIPQGEADFLVVLAEDQVEHNLVLLRPGGRLIAPAAVAIERLPNRRSLNVALLGALSRGLDLPHTAWEEAIRRNIKLALVEDNLQAFQIGSTL